MINARDFRTLNDAVYALSPPNRRGPSGPGGSIFLPAGDYVLTQPINLRDAWGVTIFGEGHRSRIVPRFAPEHAMHPVFDGTGAVRLSFFNLAIDMSGDVNERAACALLFGRNELAQSAGFHRVDRVDIAGRYEVASIVNVASETNTFMQVVAVNQLPTRALLLSCDNVGGVQSPFGKPPAPSTMLQISFYDCFFGIYCDPHPERTAAIHLDCAHNTTFGNVEFVGGGVSVTPKRNDYTSRDNGGRTALLIEARGTAGLMQNIHFRNMRWETNGARNAVVVRQPDRKGVYNVSFEDTTTYQFESFLHADGLIRNWRVRGVETWAQAHYEWGEGSVRPLVDIEHSERCEFDLSTAMLELQPLARGGQGERGATRAIRVRGSSRGDRFSAEHRDAIVLPENTAGTRVSSHKDASQGIILDRER